MNSNQPFGKNNIGNMCMPGHHKGQVYRIKVAAEVRYAKEISGLNLEAEVMRVSRNQSVYRTEM